MIHLRFSSLIRSLIGFAGAALCALVAPAAPIHFDLPAQPLPSALVAFSKQSGADVLYSFAELKDVRSNAVEGEFEPDRAMNLLLANTGFKATRNEAGKYVVTKQALTGAIRGTLVWPDGGPAQGVSVFVRESGRSSVTDRHGEYAFDEVAVGNVLLVARAEGFQPLHITDVQVQQGRELIISRQVMRKASDTTELEPFSVTAESVTALQEFEVSGSRARPFTGGNLDLPRTINDAQPYYIFESAAIVSSGAATIEDFLKRRLTMNTVVQTNSQNSGVVGASNLYGSTSTINLRGLGADKTLILINGRRQPGVFVGTTEFQTDLNGIPVNAIDRIEVLPSSASGIYGGSAIGGVVNIILKKNYNGGEFRVLYDNIWDTDSPRRTASFSYGMSLEDGKSHLGISASFSDGKPLLVQDRADIFLKNVATLTANSPTFTYNTGVPPIRSLPNILLLGTNPPSLILRNGNVSLNSPVTHIPAGTSPTTPRSTLEAGLIANAGVWSQDLPATNQAPVGLLREIGMVPEISSISATFRRQMTPWLELNAEASWRTNQAASVYNPLNTPRLIAANSPNNPFLGRIWVALPYQGATPMTTSSENLTATLGAMIKLPGDWIASLDYMFASSKYSYQQYAQDPILGTHIDSGIVNIMVDSQQYLPALERYLFQVGSITENHTHSFSARGAGSFLSLPWGRPQVAVGLEYRQSELLGSVTETRNPISTLRDSDTIRYPRTALNASVFGEATVPILKPRLMSGIHSLDLQVAERGEHYELDTGTSSETRMINLTPPTVSYSGPTLNGQPYFTKTDYATHNYTVGLKYQPHSDVTLRVSSATAFLPPTPAQLVKNPQLSASPTNVIDPTTGARVPVFTMGGGNPDLVPQNSESFNVGAIWQPRWKPLSGLRLNVEYYRIQQFDFITSLSAQAIVNDEARYPDRVVRNNGVITQVDTSLVNLFMRDTEGWDVSLGYDLKTPIGEFRLDAVQSIIAHLKEQYAQGDAIYDGAGYANDPGGAAKYKANLSISWQHKGWSAGWSAEYFGSYYQLGAAGGPFAARFNGGLTIGGATDAQGGTVIGSQIYHDLNFGYAFDIKSAAKGLRKAAAQLTDGLAIQVGVRNVFDRIPPMDANYSSNFYLSPFGDIRLRSYWISVRKSF